MELIGKEKKPLKAKDVVLLENLQLVHPGDLTEQDKRTLAKLQARREQYGSQ